MADRNGRLAGGLAALGVRDIVVRSAMTGGRDDSHQSDRYLEAAECAGFEVGSKEPLYLPESMEMAGRAALEGAGVSPGQSYAVLHPGSGSLHKCCSPSLYMSLIDWLAERRLVPLIVGGPADEKQLSEIQAQCTQRLCRLEQCHLSQLAWIIKNAVLYVGHDSGITHLAAALAVPMAACFGPTSEARWGPRGNSVMIVRGARCQCADWDAVKQCCDKPCLAISPASLLRTCETALKNRH